MKLLIVNYHYFRNEKYKNGIYPISTVEFEDQLEYLDNKYTLISQAELDCMIKNKKNYNDDFSLITFDDGLLEQMSAFEIMLIKGIPGVFYITTDAIKYNKCVDVHKLHYIRSILDDNEIYDNLDKLYEIDNYEFDINTLGSQYKYDNELSQKIKYFVNFILDSQCRAKFIDEIFSSIVADEVDFSKKLYMSDGDILELSKNDMLGTHSASHQALAGLTDVNIRSDIGKSMDYFKSLGINNIPSISYPYGGTTAVNKRVVNISKEFNFNFGLTMSRGVNCGKDIFNNKMLLRRISCSDLRI
jgi:peptidoglycan/xylan/chitin deacetylase (PgdA/CDA1 family)